MIDQDLIERLRLALPLLPEQRELMLELLGPWVLAPGDIIQINDNCRSTRLRGVLLTIEECNAEEILGYVTEIEGAFYRVLIGRNEATKTGGRAAVNVAAALEYADSVAKLRNEALELYWRLPLAA